MQFPKRFLSEFYIMAGFISFFLVFMGCGQDAPVEKKELVRPVKILEINPSGRDSSVEFSGKISAVQEASMAFEVPGKITRFPVKEGVRVKKGSILARIDARDFQTDLDSKRADLNAARADYDRARELYETNTISKRELDVARRNYEVARAGVASARKTLEDTRLTAPFDGLVAKTLVEKYENIQAKQPVLILQDDSSLEMIVDIPERDYARVDKSMSLAEMTRVLKPEIMATSFPDKRFKASFKEAAATADSVTRTFEVTLGFSPPSDIYILPGMTARLIITGRLQKKESAVYIPANAVLSDDKNQPTVWLIQSGSNKVKRHVVEVGGMTGENIEILSGLNTGDFIAVSGVHQLREGMTVRKYVKP